MNNASSNTVATIKIIAVGDACGPWACDITNTHEELGFDSAWSRVNNAGGGDTAGDEGDDINDLAEELGGVLIHKSAGSYEVAVYEVPA